LAVAFLLSGCKGLYDWGGYEDTLFRPRSATPGETSTDRKRLTDEIASAKDKPGRIPPGKHAYVGWLHLRAGDKAQARKCFEAEKLAFPESGLCMDRLIAQTK
jgi:hypothetical protein